MATFDNRADNFLRPLFADYRKDTMGGLRPAGALAARREYRSWRTSRLVVVGVATGVAVLLAAGGGYAVFHRSGQALPVTGSPTPQTVPSTGPNETPTTSPSSVRPPVSTGSASAGPVAGQSGTGSPASSPGQPGTPPCHSSGLSVSRQGADGAMGQVYTNIVLRNSSGQPCYLAGRPAVQAVDAAGQVLPATVGDTGSGGGGRVVLPPGGSGYVLFKTTQPDLIEGAGPPCQPPAAALLVTPPGESASLRLPGPWNFCAPAIGGIEATPPVPLG